MDDIVEALTMLLGVQDPESRRKARNLKRKDAENENENENGNGNGNGDNQVDLNDDDEYDLDLAPSSKRRRV